MPRPLIGLHLKTHTFRFRPSTLPCRAFSSKTHRFENLKILLIVDQNENSFTSYQSGRSKTAKTHQNEIDDQNIAGAFVCSHLRRPRGSQSGREKRRDEAFQAWVEKPLSTDSHRTISKRSSECQLLIGHKKCFVLLCPIGEQHLLSSFREFVHDGY